MEGHPSDLYICVRIYGQLVRRQAGNISMDAGQVTGGVEQAEFG
jgi:hypothetical protein